MPTQDLWVKGRPCDEVDTLHQIRLLYLHTSFLVEWTASRHGLYHAGSLFASASELLAWVNEALVRREQLSSLGLISLAWRVCGSTRYYSVLLRALMQYFPDRFPPALSLLRVPSPGTSCNRHRVTDSNSSTPHLDDTASRICPS